MRHFAGRLSHWLGPMRSIRSLHGRALRAKTVAPAITAVFAVNANTLLLANLSDEHEPPEAHHPPSFEARPITSAERSGGVPVILAAG
jgi:hypothetical protein